MYAMIGIHFCIYTIYILCNFYLHFEKTLNLLNFFNRKYEEVYPPDVSEFVYITDDTYTKKEVLRMEHLILKVLSFDLSTPTSLAFLSLYCISNALSKKIFHLAAVSLLFFFY